MTLDRIIKLVNATYTSAEDAQRAVDEVEAATDALTTQREEAAQILRNTRNRLATQARKASVPAASGVVYGTVEQKQARITQLGHTHTRLERVFLNRVRRAFQAQYQRTVKILRAQA